MVYVEDELIEVVKKVQDLIKKLCQKKIQINTMIRPEILRASQNLFLKVIDYNSKQGTLQYVICVQNNYYQSGRKLQESHYRCNFNLIYFKLIL
jgi:hypothetical protein